MNRARSTKPYTGGVLPSTVMFTVPAAVFSTLAGATYDCAQSKDQKPDSHGSFSDAQRSGRLSAVVNDDDACPAGTLSMLIHAHVPLLCTAAT